MILISEPISPSSTCNNPSALFGTATCLSNYPWQKTLDRSPLSAWVLLPDSASSRLVLGRDSTEHNVRKSHQRSPPTRAWLGDEIWDWEHSTDRAVTESSAQSRFVAATSTARAASERSSRPGPTYRLRTLRVRLRPLHYLTSDGESLPELNRLCTAITEMATTGPPPGGDTTIAIKVVITCWILEVIAVTLFVARIITRWRRNKRLYAEDYLISVAMVNITLVSLTSRD